MLERRGRLATALTGLLFLAASTAIGLAWWRATSTRISLPLGPDPSLWGEAALLFGAGMPVSVPPLFPALASLLSGDGTLEHGALLANAGAVGATVGLVGVAAAQAQQSRWMGLASAATGCALGAVLIDPTPHVLRFQPEVVALAALTAVAAAGALLGRTRTLWAAGALGLASGFAFVAREHGLVVVIVAPGAVLLLVRGPWWRRLAALVVLAIGVQIGATAFTTPLKFLPFWMSASGTLDKAQVALRDTLATWMGQPPPFVPSQAPKGVPLRQAIHDQALVLLRSEAPLLIAAAIGLVLLAVARGWRIALGLGLGLCPAAALFAVWTLQRHIFVVRGAALAAAVAGGCALVERVGRRFPRAGPALVALGGLVGAAANAPAALAVARYGIDVQAKRQSADLVSLVRWVRTHAEPGSILVGPVEVAVATGLPWMRPNPRDLGLPEGPPAPDVVWREWVVARWEPVQSGDDPRGAAWGQQLSAAWEPLRQFGPWWVYRLRRPPGVPVRCLYGEIPPIELQTAPHGSQHPTARPALGCE